MELTQKKIDSLIQSGPSDDSKLIGSATTADTCMTGGARTRGFRGISPLSGSKRTKTQAQSKFTFVYGYWRQVEFQIKLSFDAFSILKHRADAEIW